MSKVANLVKDAMAFATVVETKLDEATDLYSGNDNDGSDLLRCWRDAQDLLAKLEALASRLDGGPARG